VRRDFNYKFKASVILINIENPISYGQRDCLAAQCNLQDLKISYSPQQQLQIIISHARVCESFRRFSPTMNAIVLFKQTPYIF
jgi:hypothetical protein